MASLPKLGCEYCGRTNFLSQNSLTRHQSQSSCAARKIAAQQLKYVPPTPNAFDETNKDDAFDVPWFPPTPPQKPAENLRQARDIPVHEIDAVTYQITEHFDEAENDSSDTDSNQGKYDHITTGFDIYNNDSDTDMILTHMMTIRQV